MFHPPNRVFVDDDQGERCEFHVLVRTGHGADTIGACPSEFRRAPRCAPCPLPAGEQRHGDAQGFEPRLKILRVVVGRAISVGAT